MSRRKKKKLPPFVAITREMIRSKAWKELSCHARAAYVEIKYKYRGNDYENEIEYTYSEAKRHMGMHRDTFSKVLNELNDNGLLDVVESGGLQKRPNVFAISERWKFYGTERFVKKPRTVPPRKW